MASALVHNAIAPTIPTSRPNTSSARNDSNGGTDAAACPVNVVLRIRPQAQTELMAGEHNVLQVHGNEVSVTTHTNRIGATASGVPASNKPSKRQFAFDQVFPPSTDQQQVYDCAVRPLVESVLEGYNSTAFCYGQTGTGKTYTMEGDLTSIRATKNAGVLVRSISNIFETLEAQQIEYTVKLSVLELYDENLSDLLAEPAICPDDGRQLRLFDDTIGKKGVMVHGLEEVLVTSPAHAFSLINTASTRRRTAETLMNKSSSRSHCMYSISVFTKESSDEGEDIIKTGKLNLVDLAGSENIGRSGAQKTQAAEAGAINRSLLTLGRVINALVDKQGFVPYRESKLTRLLQESLGGRAKTVIIATISPSSGSVDETMSTLDYAFRAKNIKNKPQVNAKMTKRAYLKELLSEITGLKREIEVLRTKNGIILPPERYEQLTQIEHASKSMMQETHDLITRKETEMNELNCALTETKCNLDSTLELKRGLETKLNETENDLGKTKLSLSHTEFVLSKTREVLGDTKRMLRNARYELARTNYIVDEHGKTESELSHQAQVTKTTLETVIAAKDELHGKIDRQQAIVATNNSITEEFEKTIVKQIDINVAALKQVNDQSSSQVGSIIDGLNTVNQEQQANSKALYDALSMDGSTQKRLLAALQQNTAASLSATLVARESHCESILNNIRAHVSSVDSMAKLSTECAKSQAQVSQEIVSQLKSANVLQTEHLQSNIAADSKHAEDMKSWFTDMVVASKHSAKAQTQQIASVQQLARVFCEQQQEMVDTQAQKLILTVSSMVEEFKTRQVKSMQQAVYDMSQVLENSISTWQQQHLENESRFNETAEKNAAWLLNKNKLFDDACQVVNANTHEAVSQVQTLMGTTDKYHAALNDKFASTSTGLSQLDILVQQQLEGDKQNVHVTLESVENDSQSLSNAMEIATAQRTKDVERLSEKFHNRLQTVATIVDGHQRYLSQHFAQQSDVNTGFKDVTQNYIHTDLKQEQPTCTTPRRNTFHYPRSFASTAPHEQLKANFDSKHSHMFKDEDNEHYNEQENVEPDSASSAQEDSDSTLDDMQMEDAAQSLALPLQQKPLQDAASTLNIAHSNVNPDFTSKLRPPSRMPLSKGNVQMAT